MNSAILARIDYLSVLQKSLHHEATAAAIAEAQQSNPWFIPEFANAALQAISQKMLSREALLKWLTPYTVSNEFQPKKLVGLVMAGNVPLVGFHDFLCAYLLGFSMQIRLSSKDDSLFHFVLEKLMAIDPQLKAQLTFVNKLEHYDAVIATGSDNTFRYFEYYFRNHPRVLRRNRNSVAVLSGNESLQELQGLADDVLLYFGFGCRNVSKLFVPESFEVESLFPHFEKYKWMHQHTKYMNNYDYNRTLLLLNKVPHLSNDFLMIQENTAIASPIAVLYFERYHNIETVRQELQQRADKIQCVVSQLDLETRTVPFGQSQQPELNDYADGVDTIDFLLKLGSEN
ncbi:MAG: acyl-CoA reductase [Chitinophagales bacterium]